MPNELKFFQYVVCNKPFYQFAKTRQFLGDYDPVVGPTKWTKAGILSAETSLLKFNRAQLKSSQFVRYNNERT